MSFGEDAYDCSFFLHLLCDTLCNKFVRQMNYSWQSCISCPAKLYASSRHVRAAQQIRDCHRHAFLFSAHHILFPCLELMSFGAHAFLFGAHQIQSVPIFPDTVYFSDAPQQQYLAL
eukprot:216425_1